MPLYANASNTSGLLVEGPIVHTILVRRVLLKPVEHKISSVDVKSSTGFKQVLAWPLTIILQFFCDNLIDLHSLLRSGACAFNNSCNFGHISHADTTLRIPSNCLSSRRLSQSKHCLSMPRKSSWDDSVAAQPRLQSSVHGYHLQAVVQRELHWS